jgi:hypothetical protein
MGTLSPLFFLGSRDREVWLLFCFLSKESVMQVRNIKHTLRVIRRRVIKVGTPRFRQIRII